MRLKEGLLFPVPVRSDNLAIDLISGIKVTFSAVVKGQWSLWTARRARQTPQQMELRCSGH